MKDGLLKPLLTAVLQNSDPDFKHAIDSPMVETVAGLEKRKMVEVSYHTHRLNFEKTIIELHGIITSIREEDDNDIHIELKDNSMGDSTVCCEAVDPNDAIAATSPYLEYFRAVRKTAVQLNRGDKVTIIGVLFEDKYHTPHKYRIRNFLEVHPILKIIVFLPNRHET